jgi:hypothetical protein
MHAHGTTNPVAITSPYSSPLGSSPSGSGASGAAGASGAETVSVAVVVTPAVVVVVVVMVVGMAAGDVGLKLRVEDSMVQNGTVTYDSLDN